MNVLINGKNKMKIFKQKKAQAAMEFLMTYGWALLVVLIAIAALAFFGLLNPNRFLSDKVTVGVGFQVSTAAMDESGVAVLVQNGIGRNVNDFTMTVANCNNGAGASSSTVDIPEGDSVLLVVPCREGIAGTKFSSGLNYSYDTHTAGIDVSHAGQGDLFIGVGDGNSIAGPQTVRFSWNATGDPADSITSSVSFRRRQGGGPLLNINIDDNDFASGGWMDPNYYCSEEEGWYGPSGTEWYNGPCGDDPASLSYTTWYGATTGTCCWGGSCNRQALMVGSTYCIHITAEDVYYNVTFFRWDRGCMGTDCGFLYERTGPYY